MTVMLTPGENYREAMLLTDRAVDAHGSGTCGERDYLLKMAAVHAQLAGCDPETYVDAAAADAGDEPAPVPVGGVTDLQHRIDRALAALAGPWPSVGCAPSVTWAARADEVVRALTGPFYGHWVAANPNWPGAYRLAPGADDQIIVSAEDLRTVVAAVVENRYAAQTDNAIRAAHRLAGPLGIGTTS